MTPRCRLGSRGSPLARVQAEWVAARLGEGASLVWIRTEGDEDATRPLAQIGGVGVFTAALHRALLADRVDVAVHSLKDLPAGAEAGVVLAAVPTRADPRDALVSRGGVAFADLPRGATVGTDSPRRGAQLRRLRPDVRVVPARGNVGTRLARLEEGACDAIVLAVAGLARLGLEDRVTHAFSVEECVPAAGQGALGLVVRDGDARSEACVVGIADVAAAAATAAERAALRALGAGCRAPVGSHATVEGGRVRLHVRALAPDGSASLEERAEGGIGEAVRVGEHAAAALLARGAGAWTGAR